MSAVKNVYLAVDIGASSGRHMAQYIQDGKMCLKEVYRFPNGAERINGRLFWKTDRLFREIINGLKAAKEQGFAPSFVGIDTWAVDYLLLDGADAPIGEAFSYRDARGGRMKDKVHSILPFCDLYRRTGIQYAPFNTVYQLADDKEAGRLDGAESFLMLPDYFGFLLTGEKKQEYTNATSTGMVNALTHEWDRDMISALGFKDKLFGGLKAPGSTLGEVKEEIAREIGYKPTVLIPATHDTASAVAAAPLLRGEAYLSSGTWSLLGAEVPAAVTSDKAREYNFSNEGGVCGGFRFQKNIIGLWIVQEIRKELENKYSFAELAQMAAREPTDAEFDAMDDVFLAPESMLACVESRIGKAPLGQTLYAVFNSLAKCYAKALCELEDTLGRKFSSLRIIGGGSQNELLNRLTAEATGKEVLSGPKEATAIGNAVMQMIATGEIENLAAGRELVMRSF